MCPCECIHHTSYYPLVWLIEQYKHAVPRTIPALLEEDPEFPELPEFVENFLTPTVSSVGSLEGEPPSSPLSLSKPARQAYRGEYPRHVTASPRNSKRKAPEQVAGCTLKQIVVAVSVMMVVQHFCLYLHLTTTSYWSC